MSPVGKSGRYFMNPNEMRRQGDMPKADEPGQSGEMSSGDAGETQGDGMRHHEIHEMPEGGAHSTRTEADGTKEEMDHDSFEDACASCAGGEDEPDGDEGDSGGKPPMDMGGMDDMAGMYEKAGQKR